MQKVDVLLGLQWGDEGKGKIVDVLTPDYNVVARFQGGPNAGHTLEFDQKKYILNTIPSGVFRENTENIIGNGVVIDPIIFKKEIDNLLQSGVNILPNLYISKKAHLILPTHKLLDAASEKEKGDAKIGSTLKGIGPTYMDKTGRNGLRVGDILHPNFMQRYQTLRKKHEQILHFYDFKADIDALEKEWLYAIDFLGKLQLIDSDYFIDNALKNNKKILAEGAQGTLLDIDFGSYPFVTSSNTITAGVCTGLGVAPNKLGEVLGIAKAYCTRVGGGPFPTELDNEIGDQIRQEGKEFGSTTGRARRCGWLDLPALKYACMINGVSQIILMKIDVLSIFDEIKICTDYEIDGKITRELPYDLCEVSIKPIYQTLKGWKSDLSTISDSKNLPQEVKQYTQFIENYLQLPVRIISVGPNRNQTLFCK